MGTLWVSKAGPGNGSRASSVFQQPSWWEGLPGRDTPRQQLVGCVFICCAHVQSLFLEQVLDKSLCHSCSDLAKHGVMSTCARKNSGSHLASLPGSNPNFSGCTRSLLVTTPLWLCGLPLNIAACALTFCFTNNTRKEES